MITSRIARKRGLIFAERFTSSVRARIMCAKRRTRNSQRASDRLPLYAADTTLGWRVIRRVSLAFGRKHVAEGKWREAYDDDNKHIGYQEIPGPRPEISIRSASGLVARDIELNAGRAFKNGKSRTAGLTDEQRSLREQGVNGKRPRPAEDAVERVEAKVRVWPDLTGDKQDVLRVWPKK